MRPPPLGSGCRPRHSMETARAGAAVSDGRGCHAPPTPRTPIVATGSFSQPRERWTSVCESRVRCLGWGTAHQRTTYVALEGPDRGGLRCMHADAKGAPGLPGGDAPHPNVQREVGMHMANPTGTPDRSYSGCPGQHHPLAHRSPEGRWGGRTPAPEGLPLDRAGLCGLAPAMPLLRGACILYLLWRWRIGAGGTQRSPGESARPLRGV